MLTEATDKRLQNLQLWRKGVSANPGGKQRGKRYCQLYAEQEAALVAHHGRPLLPRETLLLDELIDLKLRKPKNVEDTVKRANSLSRLLQTLYSATDAKPVLGSDLIKEYARKMQATP